MKLAILTLSLFAVTPLAWAGPQNFSCSTRSVAVTTVDMPQSHHVDRMYHPDTNVEVNINGVRQTYEGFSTTAWSPLFQRVTFDLWQIANPALTAELVVVKNKVTGRGRPNCGRGSCEPLGTESAAVFETFTAQLNTHDGNVYSLPCIRN